MSGFRVILPLVFMVIGVGCSASGGAGGKYEKEGYTLAWADEFNRDGKLNEADWNYEKGFIRNQELQWYQADNARCEKGCLVIEARRESRVNPKYAEGSRYWPTSQPTISYTSASVNTRGKHSWRYGRFEMRGRIDVRNGSWPAYWTLGNSGGWPACGEVDIMEYFRGMLLANVAWARVGGNGSAWNSVRKKIVEFGPGWAEQFHVWRMDWDEHFIRLYCDGRLMNTQDLSKTVNPDGVNPFHQPVFIMLNQAIGGTVGGDPSQTAFPVRYEIDYVRVYQKK